MYCIKYLDERIYIMTIQYNTTAKLVTNLVKWRVINMMIYVVNKRIYLKK